ncbi:MAG TPA: TIGR01777 family oxidoreductase [Cryomorphaceae bacterium]|nr:TIGR01777 family oxidoreductase [Cryomorphaceae bacterium]
MNITIAGGSGFLGTLLSQYFSARGHQILILSRNPKAANEIYWTGHYNSKWVDQIQNTDILINLSGKSVDCRYTDKNKKLIIDSRITPTMALHKAIAEKKIRPKIWFNASSATIYVHAETQHMTEKDGVIGDDFSMNVCKKWEEAFFSTAYPEIRHVALRTSIVLGKKGGAFKKLKPLVRFGLGGHQGRGDQKMSWIHEDDFCRAIDFIIENEKLSGPINVTAPNPVINRTFMKELRKKMGSPIGIPQPTWMLEVGAALIGTETELLLKSRFVSPKKLIQSGFNFSSPDLDSCLTKLT